MSSKIDPIKLFESVISNDPENYLRGHEAVYQVTESEVREFARQIAAPAVERKPALWVHPAYLKRDDGWTPLAIDATLNQIAPLQIPLYTETPEVAVLQKQLGIRWKEIEAFKTVVDRQDTELAELQATIDKQAAEIERLQEAHEQVCTNYNKISYASEERGQTIAQLQAEIERLKGGQGEPLRIGSGVTVQNIGFGSELERKPYLVFANNGDLTEVNMIDVSLVSKRRTYTLADLEAIGVRIEQPAPVSFVLPERKHPRPDGDNTLASTYNINLGWNACLDKVKELNQ